MRNIPFATISYRQCYHFIRLTFSLKLLSPFYNVIPAKYFTKRFLPTSKMTMQAGYSSYTDKLFFSFLFLPNLSFLTLLFFYLPTFPLVNFNPPTVFILVKWLKFGFINSCHDNPHRLLYFLLFFYFYFTFTNALFWLSPLLRLISYLFFRSEHVVPGPSSRLETCFPFMLGTSWFTTFVLFKTMGGTSTAILCKCWPLSFFSLVPRFCASYFYLFLPLYFLYTDF